MTVKIHWTDRQAALLRRALPGIDPMGELDDDTVITMTEEIGHYLVLHGVDAQDEPNEEGRLCESIIDRLCEA